MPKRQNTIRSNPCSEGPDGPLETSFTTAAAVDFGAEKQAGLLCPFPPQTPFGILRKSQLCTRLWGIVSARGAAQNSPQQLTSDIGNNRLENVGTERTTANSSLSFHSKRSNGQNRSRHALSPVSQVSRERAGTAVRTAPAADVLISFNIYSAHDVQEERYRCNDELINTHCDASRREGRTC